MNATCYNFNAYGDSSVDKHVVPCGPVRPGEYTQCCGPGDYCLSNDICKYNGPKSDINPKVDSQYYLGFCTDKTGNDISCNRLCLGSAYSSIVYEGQGRWRCCYSGKYGSCIYPEGPKLNLPAPSSLSTSSLLAGETPTSTPTPKSSPSPSNSHLGVEVGVPVGVVVVIIAVVIGFLFYRRRKRASKEPSPEQPPQIVQHEPKTDNNDIYKGVFPSSPIQQTPVPAYSSFAAEPPRTMSPSEYYTAEKTTPSAPPVSGLSYKAGPYDSLMPPAELPGDQGASEVDGTSASRASTTRPGIVSMTSELSDPGSEPRSAVSEMPSPGLSATGEQKPLV